MSRPTPRQISDLFATLRAFAVPVGKPPHSRLDDLERRLLVAVDRDDSGTTTIDGYPANTLPAGRGGAELTSVEAAADRLAFGRQESDLIRDHTWHAITFLVEAASNLGALEHRLDLIDKVSALNPPSDTAGTGYCGACGRWCSGAANDRLRSGYCDGCRKAWERAGRPDRVAFERTRRVPTETAGPAVLDPLRYGG